MQQLTGDGFKHIGKIVLQQAHEHGDALVHGIGADEFFDLAPRLGAELAQCPLRDAALCVQLCCAFCAGDQPQHLAQRIGECRRYGVMAINPKLLPLARGLARRVPLGRRHRIGSAEMARRLAGDVPLGWRRRVGLAGMMARGLPGCVPLDRGRRVWLTGMARSFAGFVPMGWWRRL